MQLISSERVLFLKVIVKYGVFQADMTRWGKYSTGRYCKIGV